MYSRRLGHRWLWARVLVQACRPRQWTKNVLVLTAPVVGGVAFDPHAVAALSVAVLAFTLAASGVYLVNDAIDVAVDRLHPTKRRRPVAAGALSVRAAWTAAAVLLPAALIVSDFLLRAIAGGVATHVPLSQWFLIAAGFGSLWASPGTRACSGRCICSDVDRNG